jgi:tetratricopeptide (TPR) repeat protein
MSLLQGLHLYEIVLMVLGVILFIRALFLMKSSPKSGAAYFLISAIFIGWPSVKSIEFGEITVELNNQTEELLKNPTDTVTRQAVVENLKKIEGRSTSDPHIITLIARAQFATGNEAAAETNLNQALKADPKLPEALALRQKIASIQKLDQLTEQVKSNPQNEAAKQELTQHLAQVAKEPIANPNALATVAQAQAAVGNKQEAAGNAAKALQISPNVKRASELKNLAAVPR